MKPRLLSGFVLMVVLPTAVLGLLAVRALRDQERLLRQSTVAAAQVSIEDMTRSLTSHLSDDLGQIRLAMTDCLVRGWDVSQANAAAVRLKAAIPTVAEVYVFMNPWGFLLPEGVGRMVEGGRKSEDGSRKTEVGDGEAVSASNRQRITDNQSPSSSPSAGVADASDRLVGELRSQIAGSDPAGQVSFTLDGASYSFVSLQARKSLYAGCRYDTAAVRKLVEEQARSYRGGMYRIAVGPAEKAERESGDAGDVIVLKPFKSPKTDERGERWRSAVARQGQFLTEGFLPAPLEGVGLVALTPDRAIPDRSGLSRTRLLAWAMGLLTIGILAGAGLVLLDAVSRAGRAEARNQFIAGISHDLRTPIAAVRMLSESLSLGRVPDPEKQKAFLDRILRETCRLGDLVDRVLFLVKFGQGPVKLASLPVGVGEVIKRSMESIEGRYLADASAVKPIVSVRIAQGLPVVTGDHGALEQVVMNLLDNAVKYGGWGGGRGQGSGFSRASGAKPPGGTSHEKRFSVFVASFVGSPPRRIDEARDKAPDEVSQIRGEGEGDRADKDGKLAGEGRGDPDGELEPIVTIDVGVVQLRNWRRRGSYVRVRVSDRGPGLSRSELRRVFRPFYRGESARAANLSGVGLGLTMSRDIVRRHGGWMEAASEKGKGSVFSLFLPVG